MTNSRGRRRDRGRAIANDGRSFAAAFAVAAAAEPTLPNVGVPPPTHAATTALLNSNQGKWFLEK